MILQRAYRGNNNHGIGLQVAQTALDVQELLSAQVSTKSSFRYGVIAQSQRHARCHDGIAAVRNIREGTAMHECRRSFKRLHQVRLDGILQKSCHSAFRVQLMRRNGLIIVRVAHHNATQALLEVGDRR